MDHSLDQNVDLTLHSPNSCLNQDFYFGAKELLSIPVESISDELDLSHDIDDLNELPSADLVGDDIFRDLMQDDVMPSKLQLNLYDCIIEGNNSLIQSPEHNFSTMFEENSSLKQSPVHNFFTMFEENSSLKQSPELNPYDPSFEENNSLKQSPVYDQYLPNFNDVSDGVNTFNIPLMEHEQSPVETSAVSLSAQSLLPAESQCFNSLSNYNQPVTIKLKKFSGPKQKSLVKSSKIKSPVTLKDAIDSEAMKGILDKLLDSDSDISVDNSPNSSPFHLSNSFSDENSSYSSNIDKVLTGPCSSVGPIRRKRIKTSPSEYKAYSEFDKIAKKKEQNKNAAHRYRIKKKLEDEELYNKLVEEQKKHKELKRNLKHLKLQVKSARSFLRDAFIIKGMFTADAFKTKLGKEK